MIRRLQKNILQSLLPPRFEVLLFCRPTKIQCDLYKKLTSESSSMSDPLPLLTKLRKLCTHPRLLHDDDEEKTDAPMDFSNNSGKLDVLEHLLGAIRSNNPKDKVVVVSNFTSALTVIENTIVRKHGWSCLRLDGTVQQSLRQSLVDSFNRGSVESSFIFLLSSKAGGCGLNLIGGEIGVHRWTTPKCKFMYFFSWLLFLLQIDKIANRLVMVDGDWNPATDLQAMARIYRQGQTKRSFIYRLHTSGTVEEG